MRRMFRDVHERVDRVERNFPEYLPLTNTHDFNLPDYISIVDDNGVDVFGDVALLPNNTFICGGVSYTTDDYGRVTRIVTDGNKIVAVNAQIKKILNQINAYEGTPAIIEFTYVEDDENINHISVNFN